jgi:hypothetical protein
MGKLLDSTKHIRFSESPTLAACIWSWVNIRLSMGSLHYLYAREP